MSCNSYTISIHHYVCGVDIYNMILSCGQVWPINVDLKFIEPVQKELKLLGKVI